MLLAELEDERREMYADLEQRERALDATEAWLDRRERKLEERQRRYEVLVK